MGGKISLDALNQSRDASLPISASRAREVKIKKLGQQIAESVCVDKPLPAAMLSRYCATVCLYGMEGSLGRDRIDWTNTLCRILKLEHELKKAEKADERPDDYSSLTKMFDASGLMRELEEEVDALEEDEKR